MRVTIIIPALNEAGNITRLIGEIPHDIVASVQVIVVDNGSTDDTAKIAAVAGAQVVSEPRRGYGQACAAGVAAIGTANVMDHGSDVVVFLDGDGSFDPAEISRLIAPITENRADMVLGSRALGGMEPGAMPPHQQFGNRLVSRLMGLLYGLRLTDLGPFRAVRWEILAKIDMREMTFGWPTEMIVKAANLKTRIIEVPVSYRCRWTGKSKVSGTLRGTLLATYFILGVTLRYAFNRRTR
ncbi:MAG: glycosyltransferase family 2 protein [Chloroflexota bacterium]